MNIGIGVFELTVIVPLIGHLSLIKDSHWLNLSSQAPLTRSANRYPREVVHQDDKGEDVQQVDEHSANSEQELELRAILERTRTRSPPPNPQPGTSRGHGLPAVPSRMSSLASNFSAPIFHSTLVNERNVSTLINERNVSKWVTINKSGRDWMPGNF